MRVSIPPAASDPLASVAVATAAPLLSPLLATLCAIAGATVVIPNTAATAARTRECILGKVPD
jgi:hypothetical protein